MENMDKGGTHSTKMSAYSSAENTPNAPEFIYPICLLNPKKFRISMKKGFIGRP